MGLRDVPGLPSYFVQLQLLHTLLRGHCARDIHLLIIQLMAQEEGRRRRGGTLLAKKMMGMEVSRTLACCKRVDNSSLATHMRSRSVLSNTKIIACEH
jgi:hypothetical protein